MKFALALLTALALASPVFAQETNPFVATDSPGVQYGEPVTGPNLICKTAAGIDTFIAGPDDLAESVKGTKGDCIVADVILILNSKDEKVVPFSAGDLHIIKIVVVALKTKDSPNYAKLPEPFMGFTIVAVEVKRANI